MTDTVRNFVGNLNAWGKSKTPFVFFVDYQVRNPVALTLNEVDPSQMHFNFNGFTNASDDVKKELPVDFHFSKFPLAFEEYQKKFDHVLRNIKAGNSFLVNLSAPTRIDTSLSLSDIYENSEALYRLWYQDRFVCFSPEIFVKIKDNRISSFPMKGTIDASVPDAVNVILNDHKEAAEHATIVDLIRNDLSMVSKEVWVNRYRYIDRIQTNDKTLLQVSSEVSGTLSEDFDGQFGSLLLKLLPAGSITGAPKPSTLKIIRDAENYERGYYTGVMGYFDGENFESAVMIRFIENEGGRLVFKSGGGITALSNAQNEYQELIDKVYLPFSHVPHAVY